MSAVGNVQSRHLNRGTGRPMAIGPGFDGASPGTCQFFAGPPSADDAMKCGRPAADGSSYCAEHHVLCWRGASETPAEYGARCAKARAALRRAGAPVASEHEPPVRTPEEAARAEAYREKRARKLKAAAAVRDAQADGGPTGAAHFHADGRRSLKQPCAERLRLGWSVARIAEDLKCSQAYVRGCRSRLRRKGAL